MKKRLILPALALVFLAGCGASVSGIPEGLTWTAQTLQSQEDGEILAAAEGSSFQGAAPLDVTAQVEGDMVTLTDHTSGETYTGVLTPKEDATLSSHVYALVFPDAPEGYAVYGITEYSGGAQDATLYLTVGEETLCLTAPLAEA